MRAFADLWGAAVADGERRRTKGEPGRYEPGVIAQECLTLWWRDGRLCLEDLLALASETPALFTQEPDDDEPGYDRGWHEGNGDLSDGDLSDVFPGLERHSPAHHLLYNLFRLLEEKLAEALIDPPVLFTCGFCRAELTGIDAVSEAGWVPSFYLYDRKTLDERPTCAACAARHLRQAPDGEYDLALVDLTVRRLKTVLARLRQEAATGDPAARRQAEADIEAVWEAVLGREEAL